MRLLKLLFLLGFCISSALAGQYNVSGDPSTYFKQIKLDAKAQRKRASVNQDTISILSEEQADLLFREFSNISYMQFDYLHDGCFARAHEFALIAAENGIEMGKVFLTDIDYEPRLYPRGWRNNAYAPVPDYFLGWKYHVAPYILIKRDGEIEFAIFDIGVSEGPQTVSEWSAGLAQKKESAKVTYKDRGYMWEDSLHPYGDYSSIGGQLEDQRLIRELGIDEFIFRRENGWL